jgi:hypothetical protein
MHLTHEVNCALSQLSFAWQTNLSRLNVFSLLEPLNFALVSKELRRHLAKHELLKHRLQNRAVVSISVQEALLDQFHSGNADRNARHQVSGLVQKSGQKCIFVLE